MDTFTRQVLANEAEEEASLQHFLNCKIEEGLLDEEFMSTEDGIFCEDGQWRTWSEIDQALYVEDMNYNNYLMDLNEYNSSRTARMENYEITDDH